MATGGRSARERSRRRAEPGRERDMLRIVADRRRRNASPSNQRYKEEWECQLCGRSNFADREFCRDTFCRQQWTRQCKVLYPNAQADERAQKSGKVPRGPQREATTNLRGDNGASKASHASPSERTSRRAKLVAGPGPSSDSSANQGASTEGQRSYLQAAQGQRDSPSPEKEEQRIYKELKCKYDLAVKLVRDAQSAGFGEDTVKVLEKEAEVFKLEVEGARPVADRISTTLAAVVKKTRALEQAEASEEQMKAKLKALEEETKAAAEKVLRSSEMARECREDTRLAYIDRALLMRSVLETRIPLMAELDRAKLQALCGKLAAATEKVRAGTGGHEAYMEMAELANDATKAYGVTQAVLREQRKGCKVLPGPEMKVEAKEEPSPASASPSPCSRRRSRSSSPTCASRSRSRSAPARPVMEPPTLTPPPPGGPATTTRGRAEPSSAMDLVRDLDAKDAKNAKDAEAASTLTTAKREAENDEEAGAASNKRPKDATA